MRRLFVAIALPDAVKDRICDLQGGLDGASWVDPDTLHITLRFVGEVDRGVADDLEAALSMIRAPAFDLDLHGFGYFERKGRPRSLWLGVAPDEALCRLRERVEQAAKRAGLAPEGRRFKPHVTIARLRGHSPREVSQWIASNAPFSLPPYKLPPVPVREITLYRSHLGRSGARYEVEAIYPLLPSDGGFASSSWDTAETADGDDVEEPDWMDPGFNVADWIGGTLAPTISAQGR